MRNMIKDRNEIEKLKEYISEYFLMLEKRISQNDSQILKLLERFETEQENEYIAQSIDSKDIKVVSYLDN